MKIELVQITGRDGDTAYNLERTLQAIATCEVGTDMLIFPETQLMGFCDATQLAEVAEPLNGPSMQAVQRAACDRNVSVLIGMAEKAAGTFYNTSSLVTPQGIAMSYRKTHLWPSERGLFQPGDRYVTALWKGIRVGILICYDIELPESARALGQLGAELILVTNGNMDPYGAVHRTAITARAQENQAFAVMVNRVGEGDEGLVFAGGSAAIDPLGRMLFEAGREECHQVVELDFDLLRTARRDYDYLNDRRLLLTGEQIEHTDGRREWLIP
ncbi:carbon-nitrogen hydrolase family protein [Pseudomonas sp. NPDC086251]|jgi:(R)-amidase|uniref:carbon-nitrogen hydrolase family protein n=1 Tax=Pseudomonas sp. NPDC086251 TaxID=3364431 RepID=UPI003837E1A4